MAELFEDRSFKRLTSKFPIPMLKYLRVQHEMVRPYPTKIELDDDSRQFLDYVIEIAENKLFDLEFHSSLLTIKHLGHYGIYKINLRIYSKKYVYQGILCTGDPEKSRRELMINENEEVNLNIIFTLEDDADEKIKILEDVIDNNKKLTNTDIEIIYLTVALYMKSKLTKSELLLKIAELTNKVEGLTEEEIHEIKIFQKAFEKKFISEDDELKGEIDNMIAISELELLKKLFPEETNNMIEHAEEKGIEKGIEKGREEEKLSMAKNMKSDGCSHKYISKITGFSLEDIEKL